MRVKTRLFKFAQGFLIGVGICTLGALTGYAIYHYTATPGDTLSSACISPHGAASTPTLTGTPLPLDTFITPAPPAQFETPPYPCELVPRYAPPQPHDPNAPLYRSPAGLHAPRTFSHVYP